MDLVPGLVSVTFRSHSPREIVDLAARCGLLGIEWGGDVHVRTASEAREVRRITADAGLEVAAYGSYWRASGSFEPVLDTAFALGAPTVRVWAGRRGSLEEDDRNAVVEALRRACELAAVVGMAIALEWHDGTLTDSLASALSLVQQVAHPALTLYWQPNPKRSQAERIEELYAIRPFLSNLHVFQWSYEEGRTVRHPLVRGEREWQEALCVVAESFSTHESKLPKRYALIEFVPQDDPTLLGCEAATLRRMLSVARHG